MSTRMAALDYSIKLTTPIQARLNLPQRPVAAVQPDISQLWKEAEWLCKCDCITPTGIPKDLPPFDFPPMAYLELTSKCNNRCAGCSFAHGNGAKSNCRSLKIDDWRNILKKLTPHLQYLQITGGEPTLAPDFYQFIQLLEEFDIRYVLFTNGCWPDPTRMLNFLSGMPHFRGFLISLHGSQPEIHENFTGLTGSFERTIQTIKAAVQKNFQVFSSTVLIKPNLTDLNAIHRLGQNLGIQAAVYNRYVGPAPAPFGLEPAELNQAIHQIQQQIESGTNVRFGNCIPQCFTPSAATGCLAGTAFCSIDAAGNVKPCNHSDLLCGNLLAQSLAEVWRAPNMELWRHSLPTHCHQCHEFGNCHGGCRAEGWRMPNHQDPLIRFDTTIPN